MKYPLEGVRVIDIAQFLAGPGISMYLADQGADVIKVERRTTGDPLRYMGNSAFLGENGRSFMALNRNKRGITLDVRKPEGREVLLKLVEGADVLVENFRIGVADRLGIGYEALSRLNPRLVYASVTGYGPKGPHANRAAYDRIVQGVSGVMSRRLPDGTPIVSSIVAADLGLPMLMAYGILLALWARDRTGEGQKVETSLLQTYLALQMGSIFSADDDPEQKPAAVDPASWVYRCGDGAYINVTVHTDDQLVRLCTLLDLGHILDDPRLHDPVLKNELRGDLSSIIEAILLTRPAAEWLELMEKDDVPCGPIQDRAQLYTDPQVIANDMIVTVDHPKAGRTRMPGIPIRLSNMPPVIRRPAPLLGQHTDEVLQEVGYTAAEIERLRAQAVI